MLSLDIKQFNQNTTVTLVYRSPDVDADRISTNENAVDE